MANEHKVRAQAAKASALVAYIEQTMRTVGMGDDVLNDPDIIENMFARDDPAFWGQTATEAGVNPPSLETVDIAISMLVTAARTRRQHAMVLAD